MPDTHAAQAQLEPWQWPEAQWRKLVNQVRAGRAYKPKAWKGGARCAIALSFDSDHETNELRDGGKSIGRMAWGQSGNRVGIPRIRKLLDKHDVKATFYVPAVTALLYPDEQRALVAEGHEIGIHGWIHELNSILPLEAERDLLFRSSDVLEKVTGKRPLLLVMPNWLGVTDIAIERARKMAGDKYIAFVGCMYGEGKTCSGPPTSQEWMMAVRSDRVEGRKRVNAALEAMVKEAEKRGIGDSSKKAAVGFCFGGGNVLELARSGANLDAVVCLHGDLGILDAPGAHHLEADLLDRPDDLVEPLALQRLRVEGRGAEQEGEAAEEIHGGIGS